MQRGGNINVRRLMLRIFGSLLLSSSFLETVQVDIMLQVTAREAQDLEQAKYLQDNARLLHIVRAEVLNRNRVVPLKYEVLL